MIGTPYKANKEKFVDGRFGSVVGGNVKCYS